MIRHEFHRDGQRKNSRQCQVRMGKAGWAGVEALENRQLLSVDLSGAFVTIPVSAPNNTRQNFTISLENSGTDAVHGGIQFNVYAVPAGGAFNANTDFLLGQFIRGGTLAAGASAPFTFSALLSRAIEGGQYQLVAVIDPNNRIAETNEGNNTAVSGAFTITQPNYDLVLAFGAANSLASLNAGSNGAIQLVIANSAGSTATIPGGSVIQVEIFARPAGGGAEVLLNQTIANVNVGLLAPGQSQRFNVPIHVPSNISGGNYEIVADIDTTGALAETNENNNEVVRPNVVIVSSSPLATAPGNTGTVGNVGNLNPPPVNLNAPSLGNTPTNIGQLGGGGVTGTPPVNTTAPISGVGSTPTNSTGTTPTNSIGAGVSGSVGSTPTNSLGMFTGLLGSELTNALGLTPGGVTGFAPMV